MLAFLSAPWFLKIKVLRNQGIFQRLEKIQVLQTFQVSTLKKGWVYSIINLKTIQVPNLKIIQGSEDLKFFKGLKQALFSQNLDFQKSGFRLKGRVRTPRTQENASIPIHCKKFVCHFLNFSEPRWVFRTNWVVNC